MPRTATIISLLALTAVFGLTACGGSHSPTEPTPSVSAAASSTAASAAVTVPATETDGERGPRGRAVAREHGSEGPAAAEPAGTESAATTAARSVAAASAMPARQAGGPGHGNPGHPSPPPHGGTLTLAIQPDVWNTNWTHSSGTVSALIRGDGVSAIDPATVRLRGSDAAAAPLIPLRVQKQGPQLRAFFAQSAALATLDTPTPGESHMVTIDYSTAAGAGHLTATIRIVGPGGPGGGTGALTLALQPDAWNTNWTNSGGTVSALIRGDGLADIDLGSLVLIGTDPAVAPLHPLRADRDGNHVRALFAQSAAFATLLTPQPGQTHAIKVRFAKAGTDTALTDTIRVVGPHH